uniref:ATP synthase F0 subunit 6 n=1 Tax=Xestocephalus limpidissimus TaxID=3112140 RepID=UPI002E769816|nr:ATP synthase F0 subunit 6 [Xestocephalus limpidissimus]WRK21327.1 ATP synthase F0 subunit 6 [Xestocephalus limpidissimus]
MTNLFSTFDPCTGMLSINWLSMMIMTTMMPMKFWTMNNKMSLMIKMIMNMMIKEMKMLMKNKGSTLMLMSMFIFILMNNMMGLMPYIFTASSHLIFSLSMALPMWTSLMMYGWLKKTNNMFKHLIPTGTPLILIPFMIIIETISNLIRPGSLAVRLSANMIAGHLLMVLLGNNSTSMLMMTISMTVIIMLIMFETAVSMIQSYVFMTLSTLYSSEI